MQQKVCGRLCCDVVQSECLRDGRAWHCKIFVMLSCSSRIEAVNASRVRLESSFYAASTRVPRFAMSCTVAGVDGREQ